MNLAISLEEMKAFWIAFAIAAVASFPILKGLIALKSRQTVSQFAPEGHQVKQGTPTMGGLIILAGLFGAVPFLAKDAQTWPLMALVALFAIIGFVDDFVVPKMFPGKRGLGWKQKILMQLVAAVVPLLWLGNLDLLGVALGTFVILFFANAYNFSDGLDGLSGTILIGMIVGLLGFQAVDGKGATDLLTFALLGALLPFMYWNAPKAKIFMGDVGSLAIGAMLGYCAFQHLVFESGTTVGSVSALALWSFMMFAELVPVPLQIASVKLRKKKIFPYTPIHHAFEKAGWPETRVVFVFGIIQLLCSFGAITLVMLSRQ